MNFELISLASAEKLAESVAVTWLSGSSVAENEPYCVALSGGRITQKFFAAVVKIVREGRRAGDPNFRDGNMPSLPNVHFFWADERCVPRDSAESNFADAQKLLFEPLRISENQIHRIRGEEPPDVAAEKATTEICRVVPLNAEGQPVLDLIFLGMGEDGHVASLFPGEPEAMISDKAVYRTVKNSPKPPLNRITLGYPAIAAAKQVWVLASGTGKEAALRESLNPNGKTPLSRVLKLRPQTRIFSDISLK